MTAAYDLAINWKGDTKGYRVTPNDGVAFTTDSEEAYVHSTDRMNVTRSSKPFLCHICGNNHYTNRFPDREESAPRNKSEKVEDTPKKEITPTKAPFNMTIGGDWGDNADYRGLMLCQVKEDTATKKVPKLEYQHTLIQSGGHIIPTRVLLDNQSTVDVCSNIRLLKNIRKSDIALEILSTGGQTTTSLQEDLPGYLTVWFHPGGIENIMYL